MEIRNTVLSDLDQVMEIYDKARQYMRDNGNLNQWINGYPNRNVIAADISEKSSYVCVEDDQIIGVFFFTQGIDPTYINIYEGNWLNDAPYGVVHRIASLSHKKGVASYCLDWCFQKCSNIKIDTHRDNFIMQNFLLKNGFTQCGIIYLEDGAERLAFHKSI
jgi:RimJ/RimL family protein N-acetyltransferase